MKRLFFVFCVAGFLLCLCSCSLQKESSDKVQDLEFTVVDNKELPEELLKEIDQKKTGEMKNAFTTEEYLYIVVGYGEQKTSGYSIAVEELYLGKNAIYINTSLIGPSKDEKVNNAPTYPYIVIKTQKRTEPVVFQ